MKSCLNIIKPAFIQLAFLFTVAPPFYAIAQKAMIRDAAHYSTVFGETRHFRVFLPPYYDMEPQKKYPVIYFYHGWSQRYFGSSDHYADFDQGDENNGDNIANFVASHDVIVVKADGYNRSRDEQYYVRPYNIGPVETHRQFPLYFPELVDHIDSRYRTISDRKQRAIAGLSMGGFMAFWIAGKYPHLVSAAGNFCGSAEFVVGPKDHPIEYRHLDMYKNYAGLKLRLHYGDQDFIRGYHEDLNRVWLQVMDNYDYDIYEAAHSTCGLGDMFRFLMETFEAPPPTPKSWDHIDVYPKFSVWGYEINSDRNLPGFNLLENVDPHGFRSTVKNFLPDGERMPFVDLSITTPPIYEKNSPYIINDIDTRNLKSVQRNLLSDAQGKLQIHLSGSSHEISIQKGPDQPNICMLSTDIQDAKWATHHQDIRLTIRLLNKGLTSGKNVKAKLSTSRPGIRISNDQSDFGTLISNETRQGEKVFIFQVLSDTLEIVQFNLRIWDENNREWNTNFEIPIKKSVPEIKEFEIADGKSFTVAKGGNETETVLLGVGNGDGIANPGESIVLLVKDQNQYWRTDLFTMDPFINPFETKVRKSDYWGSYDHVGASAKYDVPLIASSCPETHVIEFFAEYWLPDKPLHIIKQGLIKVEVKGKDTTPPQIEWVQVAGDNSLWVKLQDGSEISSVKAKLVSSQNPEKSIEVILNNDGVDGDRAASDQVFSKKIPEQQFGIYRIIIETIDSFGNKKREEIPDEFILH